MIPDHQATLPAEQADQVEPFPRRGRREQRNLDVHAPGRLRSTSIRSGRLEASTQITRPRFVLLSISSARHGVDAPANARVATSRIPPSQSLIRFVDENVTPAESVDEAEDFLELAFAAPHPLVSEVFHLHDGDSRRGSLAQLIHRAVMLFLFRLQQAGI